MKVRPGDNLKEVSLLYVEDDEQIRKIMSRMLRRMVGRLYVAANGREGLALFEEHESQIVVSDIRMPEMDGIEMAQAIRSLGKEVYIVFLTAFGESDYLEKAIDVGAHGYLIKPVERDKLVEKLNFLADAIVNARRQASFDKLIHTLFDMQKEAIFLMERSGRIRLANRAFESMCRRFGCGGEVAELAARFGAAEGEETADFFLRYNGRTLSLDTPEGARMHYELRSTLIDELLLVELFDVTRYQESNLALIKENEIDALTRLYNRKHIPKLLEEILFNPHNTCLMMIDIDHFKRINDTYGHDRGDEVLKAVAGAFRETLLDEDHVIRWGGEEFLVALHTTYGEQGRMVAEKIRRAVERLRLDVVGGVTVSVGVCCETIYSRELFDTTVKRADGALYRAKRSGRNRVVVCDGKERGEERRG
ncbi:diguanylate cyclase [Hydrogenimonas sp.]